MSGCAGPHRESPHEGEAALYILWQKVLRCEKFAETCGEETWPQRPCCLSELPADKVQPLAPNH